MTRIAHPRAGRTPAQRARGSVAYGKETERRVAKVCVPYWPPAAETDPGPRRSRDNGSKDSPDTGDIAGAGDAFLFWSVKGRRDQTPGLIHSWLTEARTKAGARTPVLVLRADRVADARQWWAWLWLEDLAVLTLNAAQAPPLAYGVPVRLAFGDLLDLLAQVGLTAAQPATGLLGRTA